MGRIRPAEPAEPKKFLASKGEFEPNLRGEGNADGSARPEEIPQRSRRRAQLAQTGDGPCLRASRVKAERCGVGRVIHAQRQCRDIGNVVVPRILPVEKIEEFRKRPQQGALTQNNIPADAQIHLLEGRTAKLIERGLHAVDYGAVVRHAVAIRVERRS